MPQRIRYQGKAATAGMCRGCPLLLVVTDKEPDGTFSTFHEQPMCQWYLDRCKTAEDIGDAEMSNENMEIIEP